MNNLLLLGALAAGYVYFTKPKTTTKKSTSKTEPKVEVKTESIPKDAILSIGSKEIGYAIYDCNLLIIYDANKAYNYAAQLGSTVTENLGQFDELLFGKCFEDAKDIAGIKQLLNTKEKAIFVFNLLKYIVSGYVSIYLDQKDLLLELLQDIKTKLVDSLGFNASDFNVSLVKVGPFPLEKGFTITNCEKLTVTDSIKMKKYTEGTFQHAFESSNFKATDPNAPFDFAVNTLKILAPDCYAKIISDKFNKDNFVISSAFIFSGFIAYLSFRFMVKDGQIQNDAWKDSFETIDEFNAYLVSANKVLQDWIQPLLIKFGFTEESLKALYEEIQKVGKYPVK